MDELSNLKESYGRLRCQIEDYKQERKKLMEELEFCQSNHKALENSIRTTREENLVLKGQIEAYRFCIKNLKR